MIGGADWGRLKSSSRMMTNISYLTIQHKRAILLSLA